ncbi:helix-turn-helix transcriptional regulator [Bosea sp. (in: a-proteobacteria)]|uniref:helix-turn-helix domain-containing protein n=1 Tax=Bosea sp. (in: a-proteobacteria) TaxID=1871050 RepID=UPI0025C5D85C|nr:helix-turn-helix transcriptional regulator [Bosea sp. (in: a-proteobacteria)]
MLGLDLKEVCGLASVGKRTLTEYESGKRNISIATKSKLEAFYISQGIFFTLDDGEGVKFTRSAKSTEGATVPVRPKQEYLDVIHCHDELDQYGKISALIDNSSKGSDISKKIAAFALLRSGLSQKEISNNLGLSIQFFNSILSGKKTIPAQRWQQLQRYFPHEFDGVSILKLERDLIRNKKMLIDSVATIKYTLETMQRLQGDLA